MQFDHPKRIISVYISVIVFFCFLFFKLYNLCDTSLNTNVASLTNQYSQKLTVASRRGFIFDRTGMPIAGFEDGYISLIDPSKIKRNVSDICDELILCSNIEKAELMQKFSDGKPFLLRTTYALKNDYASSFSLYRRTATGYISAVHLLGYLNSDGTGVYGLEKEFDELLKKTSSSVTAIYESDALKKSFSGIPITLTENDYNKRTGITLTLDMDLQYKLEEIANEFLPKGAIVVTSVSTGEILASVSRPTFDLNTISELIDSAEGEFLNRAFQTFTPGSVFKTVVAAAALESSIAYSDFEYECTGILDVFGQTFNCYKHIGHGKNTLAAAYSKSCNCYFITLALEIGYTAIYDMAIKMGIGSLTSVDKLTVSQGNVSAKNSPPPAFVANAAMGQGDVLVTPLEISRIIGCIANNGVLTTPTLVRAYNFSDEIRNISLPESKKILNDATAAKLKEIMKLCVEEGTGILAKPNRGSAGGKTSSAESGQYIMLGDEKMQLVHSWFAGFYPYDTPLFSITVIAEGGVTHDIKSTVIFKQVCDYLALRVYG